MFLAGGDIDRSDHDSLQFNASPSRTDTEENMSLSCIATLSAVWQKLEKTTEDVRLVIQLHGWLYSDPRRLILDVRG